MTFRTYGPGPHWFRFGEQIIDVSLVMKVVIQTMSDEDGQMSVSYWLKDDRDHENCIFGAEAEAFWKFMCEAATTVLPAPEIDPGAENWPL